ncbi:hypothetical protein G6F56_013104 [Rhizopus delemar]|nr:hypothetical protein G6F56_013104 [Rhizopus delemar]
MDPFLWLGNVGFIFVRRNWTQDQDKIISSFDKIKRLGSPAWIINYVEGSRLTPKKLSEAQAFSKERNYPVLNNLLLPRVKGFASCVRQLRKTHVQYVYDLTLAYRQKAPSILRVHTRSLTPEYEFHVHVQRYAIQDLPLDETEMGHWLRYLWLEKDRRLSELNEHWIDSIDPKDIWT